MADFAEGLGARLHQERERLELTIDALAAQTGLTEQRIHLLEEGNPPEGPDAMELAALGNAGIDVVYLLTGQRVLSQAESELIENYRTGTDEQKKGSTKAGDAVEESKITRRTTVNNEKRNAGERMYTYKMVQVPPNISIAAKGRKGNEAASYLQTVVNEHASEGWEFQRVDAIGVHVRPGCFGALTGQSGDQEPTM